MLKITSIGKTTGKYGRKRNFAFSRVLTLCGMNPFVKWRQCWGYVARGRGLNISPPKPPATSSIQFWRQKRSDLPVTGPILIEGWYSPCGRLERKCLWLVSRAVRWYGKKRKTPTRIKTKISWGLNSARSRTKCMRLQPLRSLKGSFLSVWRLTVDGCEKRIRRSSDPIRYPNARFGGDPISSQKLQCRWNTMRRRRGRRDMLLLRSTFRTI